MIRILKYVLNLFGLKKTSSNKILLFFLKQKFNLSKITILSFINPFFEIIFISSLYFVLSFDEQLKFIEKLNDYNFNFFDINEKNVIYYTTIFSFIILSFYLITKLYHSYLVSQLNYLSFRFFSSRLINSYFSYPLNFDFKIKKQKLINAMAVETSRYGNIIMEILLFFADMVTAIIFIISAIYLSPTIFILCCFLAISIFYFNRNSYQIAREIGAIRIKAQESFFSFISDVLSGMKEIKINSSEITFFDYFKNKILNEGKWRFDNKWNAYKIIIITQSIIYFLLFTVITLGIHLFNIEVALLITFLILIGRIQKVITTMQNHYLKIKQNLPSLDLIDKLFDNISTDFNKSNFLINTKANVKIDKISLENLSFRYDDSSNYIVNDLSLDFNCGDRVLIQGKSGQGKSTIFKILTGFLKPTKGKIYYSDIELNDKSFYKLRNNISFISADSHIFRGSIRKNIDLIGNFSDQKIKEALSYSKLDEVINKIDGGVDGFIGENGSRLSLGERQRIIVTQIFLQDSQVLFLDETTSNLDIGFESDISKNLFKYIRKDSILFFIAHKKPKNTEFNKHFILEEGKLIKQ